MPAGWRAFSIGELATRQPGEYADWTNLKASVRSASRLHIALDFLFQQCDLCRRKRQQADTLQHIGRRDDAVPHRLPDKFKIFLAPRCIFRSDQVGRVEAHRGGAALAGKSAHGLPRRYL